MIFCGNVNVERLVVHPNNNPEVSYFIDITMDKNMPVFYVTSSHDTEWIWSFWYNKTDYEVVKYFIMERIIGCDTITDLIDALDIVFGEDCAEMLFFEDELNGECECDCENCECDKE